MKLRIDYSSQAIKYIQQHDLHDKIRDAITKSIHYLHGDFSKTADVKKLSGKWEGCYRTRIGNIRIIFIPNFDEGFVYIKKIGTRGDVYR